MGHINKTPAGTYRANFRDPAGRPVPLIQMGGAPIKELATAAR